MTNKFRTAITLVCIMLAFGVANAGTFSYRFSSTPLPKAILRIMENHPALNINFIYNELENYNTSAVINADNAYDALRQTIGMNPVTVVKAGNTYYVEALQHGKYCYTGQVIDSEVEPLVAATVMLLAPKDSAVVTYGVTSADGRFMIPCDKKRVVAKVVCMGYETYYHTPTGLDLGTITLSDRPIALRNVTVEAANTVLAPDRNVYMPTSRQKQFSQTGVDLLRHMAMPSLVIVPGSEDVTDIFGTVCELFINGMPASSEELRGMKITDVRRVEVYDSPSDPRFRGARKAINFVVQEYEYGGYTKFMAAETALNGFSNRSNLFSKFTYRKMTYDLYIGAENSISLHDAADVTSSYSIDGSEIRRRESVISTRRESNNYPATFRASLNTSRWQMRNTLSFNHESTPEKRQNGRLDYDVRPDLDYDFSRSNSEKANVVKYSGSLYWTHPDDYAIDYFHSVAYTHRNSLSLFLNDALEHDIYNKATENITSFNVSLSGIKSFDGRHRIRVGGKVNYVNDNVCYTGSSGAVESLKALSAVGTADYTFSCRKLYLLTQIGAGNVHMSINNKSHNEMNPYGRVTAQVMLSEKSRLSGYVNLAVVTHGIDMRQDAIVRSDEFMYLTGNSNLKDSKQFNTNIAYNLVPSKRISLAIFGGYDETFNRVATVYRPYKEGLLRYFLNDGSYSNAYLGASFNMKLLDNNLQIYANVAQNVFWTTGIYSPELIPLPRVQLQASYYWQTFYAMAAWASRQDKLTENSNIIIRGKGNYLIEAGWGNGLWNVSLTANNFFNLGWKSQTWDKQTPLFKELQTFYSPAAHASVKVSVSYTIGYGKKLRRDNEIGAEGVGSSAILKP